MKKHSFYHSSFTPSEAAPETLETMLVGREKIANRLVNRVRESVMTGQKYQDLLIGPRGIGKTHLLSLVRHRIEADAEIDERLALAWLPEDPYVTSYCDLLQEIISVLLIKYPCEKLQSDFDSARESTSADLLETHCEQLLIQWLQDRTLLLLAENLQVLFEDIETQGQEKLRALIQNTGQISIVATSTSLFPDIEDRNKMFFGFFRQTPLLPLSVIEARELLVKMAQLEGDQELETQLCSPLGLARVRAMHLIAGGSPRICTLFYEFLTCGSIDALLPPFRKLVDYLMPYYQGLMRDLPKQQRRIIESFCRADKACTAPEIAKQLHFKPQAVATQIKRLQVLGYLSKVSDKGRSVVYELREPLMRLAIQSKQDRGEHLKHIVEFLRLWYSPDELTERSGHAASDTERSYLEEAALRSSREGDPVAKALSRDFHAASLSGDDKAALEALDSQLARNSKDTNVREAKANYLSETLKRHEEALQCLNQCIEIDPSRPATWVQLAGVHFKNNQAQKAIEAMRKAVELAPKNTASLRLLAWYLRHDNKIIEVQKLYNQILSQMDAPKTAFDYRRQASDLQGSGQYIAALDAWFSAIELQPDNAQFWNYLTGLIQKRFWREDLCLQLSKIASSYFPDNTSLKHLHAISICSAGNPELAVSELKSIESSGIANNDYSFSLQMHMAMAMMLAGKNTEAINYLTETDSTADTPEYLSTLACLYSAACDWLNFDATMSKVLKDNLLLPRKLMGSPILFINLIPQISWQESIVQWIEVFARCKQLPLLAAKFCADSYRFTSETIDYGTVRAWFRVFQAEAKAYPELHIAIRIIGFVLDYIENPQPDTIRAMHKEERVLVEPGLLEATSQKPTEIDLKVEGFIKRLEESVKTYKNS